MRSSITLRIPESLPYKSHLVDEWLDYQCSIHVYDIIAIDGNWSDRKLILVTRHPSNLQTSAMLQASFDRYLMENRADLLDQQEIKAIKDYQSAMRIMAKQAYPCFISKKELSMTVIDNLPKEDRDALSKAFRITL